MADTIDTTFPLFSAQLLTVLGEVNTINTTFQNSLSSSWFMFVGGDNVVNRIDSTFPLFSPQINGVVNLQAGSGLYRVVTNKTRDKYYNNVASGTTIDSKIPNPFIQTALLHDEDENVIHTHSYRIRIVGLGNLHATLYTLNSVRSQTLADIVLTPTSSREQTILSNFSSQRIMLRLYTDVIDHTFDITRIIMFLKSLWTQKPQ